MKQLAYPVGIQSFKKIRQEGLVYIDKTDLIYKLISEGQYYFLSRPRRFGKSLLLSTIEAYFLGERDYFKGLAIDSLSEKWERHEVLHIDLNNEKYTAPEHLEKFIDRYLSNWEKIYGDNPLETTVGTRFEGIIKRAYEKSGRGVVILVDEYDKPLTEAILKDELSESYRETLKSLYANFKTCDPYIRFVMLTGVSRFAGVSVFTGNNLEDITNSLDFETICGITESELTSNLMEGIDIMAETNGWTRQETLKELKTWYDGYQFSRFKKDVYNPFSLLNALKSKTLGYYWHNTGTPSFLYKLMLSHRLPASKLVNISELKISLSTLQNASQTNPVSLMLQTGYLTIDSWSPYGECRLRFPNYEVRQGFLSDLRQFSRKVTTWAGRRRCRRARSGGSSR